MPSAEVTVTVASPGNSVACEITAVALDWVGVAAKVGISLTPESAASKTVYSVIAELKPVTPPVKADSVASESPAGGASIDVILSTYDVDENELPGQPPAAVLRGKKRSFRYTPFADPVPSAPSVKSKVNVSQPLPAWFFCDAAAGFPLSSTFANIVKAEVEYISTATLFSLVDKSKGLVRVTWAFCHWAPDVEVIIFKTSPLVPFVSGSETGPTDVTPSANKE